MAKPKVTTIRNFKGLSQNLALTAGAPEYALDCVNVIPSPAGLAKLRVPVDLSTAVGGVGPDQFAMFENESSKAVLAFFGDSIYNISLDAFVPTLIDTNNDYVGLNPWSVALSNNFAFMQNGVSIPLKWGGGTAFAFWGIQTAPVPTIGSASGTGITLATGRQYRAAYKNSVTGHVGAASAASASTGAVTDDTIPVSVATPAEPDAQIDTVRWYATFDGGSDYFFHSETTGAFPQTLDDAKTDEELDQSERAPLINNDPPICRYLCRWGARIFMFNLPGENTKWVAYTGYDRIFVGRPEETCPPGNRLKMETGADEISGGGVIEAGVIVFDKTNKAFMFRGQPEDITNDAPIEFSLLLRPLPWEIGCASHFTIKSTPYGLIWLSPTNDVFVYNGEGRPRSLTDGIEPIMRTVNPSTLGNSRAVYWQYKGRDWYVLAVSTGNSSQLNKILIFDMEPNEAANFGVVPLDVGDFQSLGLVEMVSGEQKLVIGQGGKLKELTVTPSTRNGIEESITSTSGTLGGYYQTGYFGNEAPDIEKFFRWGRVTADQTGIRVKRRLIKDDPTAPSIMEFEETPTGGKISTNRKARRLSYELRFQDADVSQNILELTDMYIPVSQR